MATMLRIFSTDFVHQVDDSLKQKSAKFYYEKLVHLKGLGIISSVLITLSMTKEERSKIK